MLKTLLGIIGFSAKVHDHKANDAAFRRKWERAGMSQDAIDGLAILHRHDEPRPNVTGNIGRARYQASFEVRGQQVPPGEWVSSLKSDLQPLGNQLKGEWENFKTYCRR